MDAVFFNLFVNATFSLAVGLAVVLGCIAWLRVDSGPWKLFFLSLPFVKVLYDFFQGVPLSSVLFTSLDPLNVPKGSQKFSVGFGMNNWGPGLKAVFTIRDGQGYLHGVSAGDYIIYWIAHHWGASTPTYLVLIILTVALFLVCRRFATAAWFEIRRHRDHHEARSLETRRLPFRKVDIYVSKYFTGSPFTGGILRPYICLPEETFQRLSSAELEAVLAHEMGHIRQWDLLFTFLLQLTGDFFWFVPGFRWLGRKMDRLRELIADQKAVAAGTDPVLLASVLLKLKDMEIARQEAGIYSAFLRERSLLKSRVGILLGEIFPKPPRWLWRQRVLRYVVAFWVVGAVLNSNLAGNHTGLLRRPEGVVRWMLDALERI